MKILILIACLSCVPLSAVERDKMKHAGVSFAVNTVAYLGLREAGLDKPTAILTGVALTTALGLVKELTDRQFDGQDVLYNAAGTVLSIGIVLPF